MGPSPTVAEQRGPEDGGEGRRELLMIKPERVVSQSLLGDEIRALLRARYMLLTLTSQYAHGREQQQDGRHV